MHLQQFWKFIYELLLSRKYELYTIDQQYQIAILTDKAQRNYYYFEYSFTTTSKEEVLDIHMNLMQQLDNNKIKGHYYFINNADANEILTVDNHTIHIVQASLQTIAASFNINEKKLRTKQDTNYFKKITQPELYDAINIMKYPATYFTAICIILVFIMQSVLSFIYHSDWIIFLGASNYIAITHYHEYYRAITAIFIHDDIFHVLFNTFALLSMGRFMEQIVNKLQWLILFFTAGIIANIIAAYQSPEYLFLGASGAICGFIGATLYISLVDSYFKKTKLYQEMLATMVGITIFGYALGNVSHTAHFVGFISGFIIMIILRFLHPKK